MKPWAIRHRYLTAVGVVSACTALAALMDRDFERANLTMVYLLGVVVVAISLGRGPAILAAVASVATFDFVFVPPRWTFEVADAQYLVTFAVMLIVAIVTGTLTARVREESERAHERERRATGLQRLVSMLSADAPELDLLTRSATLAAELVQAPVVFWTRAATGELAIVPLSVSSSAPSADAGAGARQASETMLPVGFHGGASDVPRWLHVPLMAGAECIGVMSLHHTTEGSPPTDHLRTMAAQIAIALQRSRHAHDAAHARVLAEGERARNALLSSVSHDLRTPLAAIVGAAGGLAQEDHRLSDDSRRLLAETIADEANRLDRQIGNLLDMSRVEAGTLRVARDWHSLEEVVGSALRRLGPSLHDRAVRIEIPVGLPLLPIDDALIEIVIANLVENAHKYSPPKQPIEITATLADRTLRLDVSDHGPGLAPGEKDRVFEKFQRGAHVAQSKGTGLGLTISRGIVEAHGGTLEAVDRPEGGACFRIRLPVAGEPPPVAEEFALDATRETRP